MQPYFLETPLLKYTTLLLPISNKVSQSSFKVLHGVAEIILSTRKLLL